MWDVQETLNRNNYLPVWVGLVAADVPGSGKWTSVKKVNFYIFLTISEFTGDGKVSGSHVSLEQYGLSAAKSVVLSHCSPEQAQATSDLLHDLKCKN